MRLHEAGLMEELGAHACVFVWFFNMVMSFDVATSGARGVFFGSCNGGGASGRRHNLDCDTNLDGIPCSKVYRGAFVPERSCTPI